MARLLGLLAGLQVLRWAFESLAFMALPHTLLADGLVRTAAYLLLLAVLVVVARGRGVCSRLFPERWTRGWLLACVACVCLVVATPFLTGQWDAPAVWAELACITAATPLFEEVLFRGHVWACLEESSGDDRAALDLGGHAPRAASDTPAAFPWRIVVVTALLFGLWHLGYADVVAWQLAAEGLVGADLLVACAGALAGKVFLGVLVGLALGAARARWGCVLPAMLLHAVWNTLA